MATALQNQIDRINSLRQEGRLTQSEARALRQQARDLANKDGRMGASDRATMNQSISAAVSPPREPSPEDATGGTTDGGGVVEDDVIIGGDKPQTLSQIPPQPGTAWLWDGSAWVQPPMPTDGEYTWDDNLGWVAQAAETEPADSMTWEDAQLLLKSTLSFYGLDDPAFVDSLTQWTIDNASLIEASPGVLMTYVRQQDYYRQRFSAMEVLRQRGMAISEEEYLDLERGYRKVLSSANLPPEFYDSYEDYAKFIANDISVAEVTDRVMAAKQMLESSDSRVLSELQEYYGVDEGGALAYLLDADKAQDVIRQQVRAAQIGGAAERYGFAIGREQAERFSATSAGQTLDPFAVGTQASLRSQFAQARRTATRERTLAGIDREAYTEMDTLESLFGDEEKRLASERRARREVARFSGTAGAARSALAQSRNL